MTISTQPFDQYPDQHRHRWLSVFLVPAIALTAATLPTLLSPTATAAQPAAEQTSARRVVSLTLAEVLQIVVQSNRDLKNAQLDRIVQRQELRQAESQFNPRFIPSASISLNYSEQGSRSSVLVLPTTTTLANSTTPRPRIISTGNDRTVNFSDQTSFSSTAQAAMQLTTRVGTQLTLTGDPLSTTPVTLITRQPLLRGFGKPVNEAPVNVARLTDRKGAIALRQTLIDKVTETIAAYRTLYQSQEEVKIQEASLANLRNQLQITTALVEAGRKARVDLIDIDQRLAAGQQALIAAQNQLTLANSAVVRLMDTGEDVQIEIPANSIEPLIQAAIAQAQSFQPDALLAIAYQNRPDYQQTTLDIETERLRLLVAQDNKRWSLDLQNSTSLGSPSQTTTSLVLAREFGDLQPETEVQRREVEIQKNTNRFNQLSTTIKREIADQLKTIRAIQQQVVAAEQATQLAQQQFAIAQELFKRGKREIFELNQKEETLTNARNNELVTRLNFWIAITELDKILGNTLNTWNIDNFDVNQNPR